MEGVARGFSGVGLLQRLLLSFQSLVGVGIRANVIVDTVSRRHYWMSKAL
jgi:hypothetical protein